MSDIDSDLATDKLAWTPSIDLMMAKWCDEAKCFEWMHIETFSYYEYRSRIMIIASNILTAVSGLSNVIAGSATVNGFQLSWIFGSLSITVSITNMLQEKLGYSTKAICHNQFSIQWGSIRRKIEEELQIPPESRKDCKTFLKYIRQDINQVSIAGNSMIPEDIRNRCFQKFNSIPEFDIPDICGQMEHTRIYVKSPDISKKFITSSVASVSPKPMAIQKQMVSPKPMVSKKPIHRFKSSINQTVSDETSLEKENEFSVTNETDLIEQTEITVIHDSHDMTIPKNLLKKTVEEEEGEITPKSSS